MTVRILQGDCRDVLRTLPAGSAQCCVTSPPYFGLRDYGHDGQIGLEPTPAEYVAQMVEVFREVRRVLRDDGTLWLNLGDSYNGYMANQRGTGLEARRQQSRKYIEPGAGLRTSTLKNKDLIGIPWRVAFALQADGCADIKAVRQLERVRSELLEAYADEAIPDRVLAVLERLGAEYAEAKGTSWYLRQDIIWAKPNPMPESVRDRCTKAHEYVFLLSKSERYFYDLAAMQEPAVAEHLAGNKSHKGQTAYEAGDERLRTKAGLTAYCERQRSKRDSFKRDDSKRAEVIPGQTVGTHRADREESDYDTATRNKRSVWTIATKPFSEAHFATMAPELAETCIKAGCPEGGTVLDPFGGAGTTGLVADQLQRDAVLCELNPDYIAIATRRIAGDAPLFADVEVA